MDKSADYTSNDTCHEYHPIFSLPVDCYAIESRHGVALVPEIRHGRIGSVGCSCGFLRGRAHSDVDINADCGTYVDSEAACQRRP